MAANRGRIIAFSALSMLLAALVDVAAYLLGGLTDSLIALAWGAARMYTPAASAVLVGGFQVVKRSLRLKMRAIISFLLSPLIAFAALALYAFITSLTGHFSLEPLRGLVPLEITPEALIVLTLVNSYLAALTLNALFALGEEIGWRGYLQPELEASGLGRVRAALVVGLIWGLWHASAILLLGHNYPENRLLGAALFIAFTTSLSLPHADITHHSSSIMPAASLHGAINAVWGLTVLATDLPRELGGLGPIGIASWTITSTATHLILRRRLFKTPAS